MAYIKKELNIFNTEWSQLAHIFHEPFIYKPNELPRQPREPKPKRYGHVESSPHSCKAHHTLGLLVSSLLKMPKGVWF